MSARVVGVALAAAVALAPLLTIGCGDTGRRKPIHVKGDAGPSVVVVEPTKKQPVANTPVPLIDEVEPDDDVAHAQPMTAGQGIRGTIGAPQIVKGKPRGDVDVYSWLETAGAPDGGFNETRVELSGVPGVDLVLEILSGDGAKLWLANDGGPGEPEVVPNIAFEAGHTYYLRVRALGDKSDPAHPYELVLRSALAAPNAEREPNDDPARANAQAAPGDANGFFGRRRDEDWFRVPIATAPGILRLELTPVEGVAPELRVMAGQTVLASARAGRGEELRLRNVGIPAAGDALVVLKAAEGRNVLDRWSLKLGVEPPLDGAEREPNDTAEKAQTIAVDGAPVAGFLWPGDVDFYRVSGAADQLFSVEVEGVDKVDLKLDRLAADGRLLAHADDAGVGLGERLPPWPVGAGALVRVTARARDSAFDAPYRLVLTPVAPDGELEREPNDAPAQATSWREGAPAMHGYLAPRGDEDVYKFTAPAGKTRATVEVKPPSGLALTVKLTDEARAPLGPSEGATRASGPVAAGHTYYISVKGSDAKASNAREPYQLSLSFE